MAQCIKTKPRKTQLSRWVFALAAGLLLSLQTWPVQAEIEYSGNPQGARQAYPALLQRFCGKKSECSLQSVRQIGDWVIFNWTDGEMGGQGLAKRQGKSWKIVSSGGGVMNAANAIEAGVPKAVAQLLVPVWCGSSEAQYRLTLSDIENCDAWELLVSRNQIYARHGRVFTHKALRDYFLSWPWYKPDPKYRESRLSAVEKANASLIYSLEKKRGYLK